MRTSLHILAPPQRPSGELRTKGGLARSPFPCPGQVGGIIGLLDVATGGAIAQLPGKIGVVFWGGLVVPSAFVIYNAVSTFLFKDPLVLKVRLERRLLYCRGRRRARAAGCVLLMLCCDVAALLLLQVRRACRPPRRPPRILPRCVRCGQPAVLR